MCFVEKKIEYDKNTNYNYSKTRQYNRVMNLSDYNALYEIIFVIFLFIPRALREIVETVPLTTSGSY